MLAVSKQVEVEATVVEEEEAKRGQRKARQGGDNAPQPPCSKYSFSPLRSAGSYTELLPDRPSKTEGGRIKERNLGDNAWGCHCQSSVSLG